MINLKHRNERKKMNKDIKENKVNEKELKKVVVNLTKNVSKNGASYVSLDLELDFNHYKDNNLDLSSYNYILLSSGAKKEDLDKIKASYRFNVPYEYIKGISKNNNIYYAIDLKIGAYNTRLFINYIQLENIKLSGIDIDKISRLVEIKDLDEVI